MCEKCLLTLASSPGCPGRKPGDEATSDPIIAILHMCDAVSQIHRHIHTTSWQEAYVFPGNPVKSATYNYS